MNNKAETPEAAIKEAMQPELVVHGLDGEPDRVIKAETPEAPVVNRDILLDALVKSEKKVTMLEDLLDMLFSAPEAFGESPARLVSYIGGVKDAFEAINGPIIR